MAKTTNREIAKLAGVSPAAVSIAMNGKTGISEETRERILNIARQLNYCTNSTSAKVLRERSTYIAALFRTDMQMADQVFYSEMCNNAMAACKDLGYTLVSTYITGEDSSLELPPAIRFSEVDGVLIFGDQKPGIYAELKRINIPFVVLDSCRPFTPHPSIYVDYNDTAYRATRHLIELGHRDLVFFSNSILHEFNTHILDGFQKATMEANISLYPNRIQLMDDVHEDAIRMSVERALAGAGRPTAFLCCSDFYALKVIYTLSTMGYRIPEDISVIGMDDINMAKLVYPGLTTMRVDRDIMLSQGLQMLTNLMRGEHCASRILPAPELVLRGTTAPVG